MGLCLVLEPIAAVPLSFLGIMNNHEYIGQWTLIGSFASPCFYYVLKNEPLKALLW